MIERTWIVQITTRLVVVIGVRGATSGGEPGRVILALVTPEDVDRVVLGLYGRGES